MRIPIFVEPIADNCYRASGGAMVVDSVEAETADAAVEKMKRVIEDRVARGARVVAIDCPDGANPWLAGVGMFREDPMFDDWQQAMADYRREANETAIDP